MGARGEEEMRENTSGYPFNRMFGSIIPSYGLFIRHAENITLDQVTMAIENKKVLPAIYLEDVQQIKNGYSTGLAFNKKSLIVKNWLVEVIVNSTGLTEEEVLKIIRGG